MRQKSTPRLAARLVKHTCPSLQPSRATATPRNGLQSGTAPQAPIQTGLYDFSLRAHRLVTYLGYGSVIVTPFTEMSSSNIKLDRSYTYLRCPFDGEVKVDSLPKKNAGSAGG